jgi:hypothetical protein
VFGHHRRDVGVVVLDQRHLARGVSLGPAAGLIAGCASATSRSPSTRYISANWRVDCSKAASVSTLPHVANVLAHPRIGAVRQAERVLQLTADGDDR